MASPTTADLTKEALENNVLTSLKTNLSSLIQGLIPTLGSKVFSRFDIKQLAFDMDLSTSTSLSASDFKGLNMFENLRSLILPSLSSALPAGTIDISVFPNLEVLKSSQSASSPFKGDMSIFTKLKTIYFAISSGTIATTTAPILSNNPNLEVVYISTNNLLTWGIPSIGNLSGLTKLKSYSLRNATGIDVATMNNILSTLRAAKTAGAPLVTVDLSGSKTPTGGASNADYLALVSAGVIVTLGTA